ncbi:MAG: hypothetical protein JOZ25_05885, partial [Actinobacteria bacterium]|nr:hypothetical protein [Actinomycetota bacterium]
MAVLTAILTHLRAQSVREQFDFAQQVAPESRFVVCYGGGREEFARLDGSVEALFIDDPTLRVPHHDRSYLGLLQTLYNSCVRDDPRVELVYLLEYDHLILSAEFETRLTQLAARSDAGLLGKAAGRRNDTNWPHFTRYRNHDGFADFIARVSRRDDPEDRYGCL